MLAKAVRKKTRAIAPIAARSLGRSLKIDSIPAAMLSAAKARLKM